MTGANLAPTVRAELEPRRQEMVDLLGRLVRIESPSDDRAGLDRSRPHAVIVPLSLKSEERDENCELQRELDSQALAACT